MIELSVIIPTRNRAVRLRRLLEALCGQTFPPDRFEVVVVDNGSNDETPAVVDELAGSVRYALRYLREDTPGLHRGRHAGWHAARAELLVFADDDVVPTSSWLAAVRETFESPEVALIGGKNLPDWAVPPPAWLLRMWERRGPRCIPQLSVLDLGEERLEVDPLYVWGCNFSVRKQILAAARGFNPDAMPPDLLHLRGDGETHVSRFVARAGLIAVYDPRASVCHAVPAERMTMAYFRQRAFAEGVSASFAGLRGERADPGLLMRAARRFLATLAGSSTASTLMQRLLPVRLYLPVVVAEAQWRGYQWHRRLFATDPIVREWVSRSDFLP